MSIKLCLLKTGETVIGDIKEVIDPDENKALGYKIIHPYAVDFTYRNILKLEGEKIKQTDDDNAEYSFKFWAPLSSDREFNFPYEFIDVIYHPHKVVEEAYNTVVNHYISENTISVEVDGLDAILSYNQDLQQEIVKENDERINLTVSDNEVNKNDN